MDSKLRILELLSEREMTVSELSKELNLSKATVSHHIDSLLREGLVKVAREERIKNFIKKYYTVSIPNGEVGRQIVKSVKESIERGDRGELFRNVVRILGYALLKTSPYLFKRIGFEVGYALSEEGSTLDDLANLWEKLRLGSVSSSRTEFVVENCYFCSGLPNVGYPYCKFDEGFIAGFLAKSLSENVRVEETKCWGLGFELCEFKIKRV